jgi:hypothetical protein
MRRIMTAVTATMLLGGLTGVPLSAASASAELVQETRIADAPQNVILGDRIRVTVKVGAPTRARVVQLQRRTTDIYGNTTWSKVSRQRVNGIAKQTFKPVATELDRERLRAVTTYKSGGRATSRSSTVRVWSWTPLSKLPAYYKTNGINGLGYSNFGMAGTQYLGWFTFGNYGAWEDRYTTGRHCKTLRGDFGLNDKSADGSGGDFSIVNVDDGATLYQSPVVHPGAIVSAQVRLPLPYRISIQARTTPADGAPALPAIGSPELLCIDLGK